tara:strand:+ start:3029 stop:3367 length:339 start_codon:yes stop_codon:yes gene_type:complete
MKPEWNWMIDIEELELEFNAFYGDKENEHTLLARMFPLIEEVKRLREIIGNREWTIKLCDEEGKRLREENKKQLDVLSTLDEMIRYGNDHVEIMKALEQGLGLPETWKEMIE